MHLDTKTLILHALNAKINAYAPYSHFKVGAALLCSDGTIYTGCNIENASYGATICAERVAIQKAVSDGKTDFSAIVITAGSDYCSPCGICRQVMREFCERDFEVILAKSETDYVYYSLDQLLPFSFSNESMVEQDENV
ncbi:Cytidine deaminase [bioreactor metagenome]|uniref:cytidine deaminase n=1 Tax=bioreactor metagenome TaxID=1076179 RepID=A0A645D0Q8_9ZZZZ